MKPTKKNIHLFVRHRLAIDATWALKALVRVFRENQTPHEQLAEDVVEDNGIGFTGTDGQFLSSLAKQYLDRGFLSEKQMAHVFKKMPKYHNQVIAMSDRVKLDLLVRNTNWI